MKKILFTTLLISLFSVITFGQDSKVIAKPVEGSKPFVVSSAQLENLEVPASMDRFGKIGNDEKIARMNMFTSLISPQNKTIEFVIQLKGKSKKEVGKNMEFIYYYLTGKKKIEPTRISFSIAPEGDEGTEFWLIPNKNISIPNCGECSIIPVEDKEKLGDFFQLKKSKK